ncbi:hypothetical protein PG994_011052 [Apiospora phragmitis]|uniref:Uncharacterized protein n=1 Tax=Apiospora phragmitis TaxID=2905665 RepID=A0ABR1TRU5_9PEZI
MRQSVDGGYQPTGAVVSDWLLVMNRVGTGGGSLLASVDVRCAGEDFFFPSPAFIYQISCAGARGGLPAAPAHRC